MRDVVALIDHLSVPEVALVGYSMGADTAVRVAAGDDRVTALVAGGVGGDLSDPPDYDPDAVASSIRGVPSNPGEPEDDLGVVLADLAKSLGGDIDALAALLEGLGRQGSPDLGAVTCPTLVITGADDDMSGGSPDELAARLPCAEAITLAGLDHLGAVFDPQFADQVIGFLDRRYPPS